LADTVARDEDARIVFIQGARRFGERLLYLSTLPSFFLTIEKNLIGNIGTVRVLFVFLVNN
jgi:hypothetical protein